MNCNQKILNVTGNPTYMVPEYVMGLNNLWIFVNGQKQIKGLDYDELNITTIRFCDQSNPISGIIEILVFK